MSQFIKLSQKIINTRYIEKIITRNDKYTICMRSDSFEGFCFWGSGYIGSGDKYIEICKKKDTIDYNTIDEWINELKK